MKKAQINTVILSTLLIFSTNIGLATKVTAPIPPPSPQGYIADIFPKNNNTNVQLLNANASITVNATDFLNDIGVAFNGTYSLFNPGSPTNLTINLPFSLGLDVENATYDVSVNNTQVPYEITHTTIDNLTNMGLDMNYWFAFNLFKPIFLLTSNFTFLENKTYVVKFQFEGIIPKPNYTRDLLYIQFYTDTNKFWKGNATERVECIVYGDNPRISDHQGLRQIFDIEGGKRLICEWNNAQNNTNRISILFDRREYSILFPFEHFILNAPVYIAIIIGIVLCVRWRIRKYLRNM